MIIRVRGFKIFKDRYGKYRCYHRESGTAVDLIKFPMGSVEFIAECSRITGMGKSIGAKPGTLGLLTQKYKKSPAWLELKPKTQEFYESAFNYLEGIKDTPLIKFTRPLIVRMRDKANNDKGWYFANLFKTTLSMLFSWAVERGYMADNPAKQIRKLKRPKDLARANRPWDASERETVLNEAADHVKPLIAAMLYTGIDPCDAIEMTKPKYKDGAFDLSRKKTGNPVWKPVPKVLKQIIESMPKHDAITLFANSYGKPWTKSGFDSVWLKLRKELEEAGKLSKGLTLKGLRHTHATMLREQGESSRSIADALGDKSESMGEYYSRDADMRQNMKKAVLKFDKNHAKIVKLSKKSVKP